ncbi:MAG: hypothetical protein HC837_01625 [Chloroflexaceae bacterium]|nr:hypothetical protein [Chloroflexaceae bacterium]
MSLIDDLRKQLAAGETPGVKETRVLLMAYDEALSEVEKLRSRSGDLEFRDEVFRHLMDDRQALIEKLSSLGLEVLSVPDVLGSWSWAWRWRGSEPNSGYESSMAALLSAFETLLGTKEPPKKS